MDWYGSVAQLVEQRSPKPWAEGSSPSWPVVNQYGGFFYLVPPFRVFRALTFSH
jgi:hypothetical protein